MDKVAWLRNKKTGGWFEIPDDQLDTSKYMNEKIRGEKQYKTYANEKQFEVENPQVLFENNVKTTDQKEIMESFTEGSFEYNEYAGMSQERRNNFKPYKSFDNQKFQSNMNKAIADIDSCIQNKLTKDVVVYRGSQDVNLKEGQILTNSGYLSTSLSKDIAKQFVGSNGGKTDDGSLLTIRVKAGTKALYIGDKGTSGNQEELLFGRNIKMKVVKVNKNEAIVEMIS